MCNYFSMKQAKNLVHAGSSDRSTNEKQNHANPLGNIAFMSKGQLMRLLQIYEMEDRRKNESILKLERETLEQQKEINNQKREIIELYSRLNQDKERPLMVIAG